MEIHESRDREITILALAGDLDQRAAGELDERFDALLARGGTQLLADLGEVTSIEAAGLRSLLGMERRLAAVDGQLVLCSLPPPVREAIAVTGLSFAVRPDRAAGLLAMSGGRKASRMARLAGRLLALAVPGRQVVRHPAGASGAPDDAGLAELTARAGSLLAGRGDPVSGGEASEPAPAPPGETIRSRLGRWLGRTRSS